MLCSASRCILFGCALLGFVSFLWSASASANVLISINKNSQQMSVSVDGVPRYQFTVSTGRAGYGTPSGTYHPQRMARTWFSKEYYNSPMPHSIFFHGGFAIHGSYEISRLGGPASHGCIRLHPANAAALFALVKSEGTGATTIVVSGNAGIAGERVHRGERPARLRNPDYAPYEGAPAAPQYRYLQPGAYQF